MHRRIAITTDEKVRRASIKVKPPWSHIRPSPHALAVDEQPERALAGLADQAGERLDDEGSPCPPGIRLAAQLRKIMRPGLTCERLRFDSS